MPTNPLIAAWQKDITELAPRRLPTPRLLIKRGFLSPWFLPTLWFAKSGAFNFFFWIVVSEDLLDCPEPHRKGIIAHECGHWARMHSVIWLSFGAIIFHVDPTLVSGALAFVGRHVGAYSMLASFIAAMGACMYGAHRLQYLFEYQADAYSVARIGALDTLSTLKWVHRFVRHGNGGKPSSWIQKRIQRIESSQKMREPNFRGQQL